MNLPASLAHDAHMDRHGILMQGVAALRPRGLRWGRVLVFRTTPGLSSFLSQDSLVVSDWAHASGMALIDAWPADGMYVEIRLAALWVCLGKGILTLPEHAPKARLRSGSPS